MDISEFKFKHLHLPSPIQEIVEDVWTEKNIQVFVKRDDLIHPIITGNKWRKLKEYIDFAQNKEPNYIISFGGAYSNHLYALAFIGFHFNIKTIGIIRGNELTKNSNPYLKQISDWGMKLYFQDRESYRKKTIPLEIKTENTIIIPEGGFSKIGVLGLEDLISELKNQINADFIITAGGTGTTAIGFCKYAKIKTIGILTLNNLTEIENNSQGYDLDNLLEINSNYIFGKYAKDDKTLNEFCENFYKKHKIIIEPTYTGRMFYGLFDLINSNYFPKNSKIVALHTGGIKLPNGTL
jgi:1-aminocyclopropane-1-carboxylate deaminase